MTNAFAGPHESHGLGGESLLSLLIRVPLIGVDPRKPGVLHAVGREGIPIKHWPDVSYVESVCGKKRLKLAVANDGYTVEWPPYKRGLPEPMVRCDACHDATGRKRPRSRFLLRTEEQP